MIIAILGWLGTICFAISGVPQAWQCTIQRHARGVNPFTLSLWMAGEVFYTIAVLAEFGWVGWLLINYLVNIAVISVIIFWKVKGNEIKAGENKAGENKAEEIKAEETSPEEGSVSTPYPIDDGRGAGPHPGDGASEQGQP